MRGHPLKEGLINDLEISGLPASITVKTSTGEEKVKTKIGNENNRNLIDLPNCFARDSLPVDSEEVVTPDQIKKWEYLDSIAKGIPDKNVQGGLIIGFNCVKTLESLELIPSKNNGAYAYKTALGCCIVETSKKSKRETNCNLMTVQQAPILNYLDTLLQRRLL